MSVTEFTLLHLKSPPLQDNSELAAALTTAMRSSDAWHAARFPSLASAAAAQSAVWFEQVDDPSRIMATARWASAAALDAHIVAGDTERLRVDADIFGAATAPSAGGVALLDSPVLSVSRLSVRRDCRDAFTAKFDEVKGAREAFAGAGLVKFGWREDVEAEAKEDEFVLVSGWASVEKHLECAQSPGYFKYHEIRPLVARADVKHYRRCL